MKIKPNKKLLSLSIITALLAFATVIILILTSEKNVIAFYNIPQEQCTQIKNTLSELKTENFDGSKIKFIKYTDNLAEQAKKGSSPSVILTYSGVSLSEAVRLQKDNAVISDEVLKNLTTTMKESSHGQNKTVPVLSGNFEIDINKTMLRRLKISNIATWNDIEAFAEKAKKEFGANIFIPGKDTELFLDTIGAMTEAFTGKAAYVNAVKIINENIEKGGFAPDKTAFLLCQDYNSPLYDTVKKISSWNQKGLLFKGFVNATAGDLNAFMESDNVSVSFMSLAYHRTMQREVIEHYSSIYFPSGRPAATRNLSAPVIHAVPVKNNKATASIINFLTDQKTQEQLSQSTGLAPVLKNCRTPDRQADDARYWIAATNAPLAGLSRDIKASPEQKEALAKEILALIRK